ncbi:hypothetical protein [Natranaerofaba carboxydovora]|uniref:hypothetical protein n=1 Tax=Natranaerofaba carboxydovora TaxID=2742683 RepID=UPI001F145FCA|nr:hypothetical protein [Natranaerofaba carboxydovora]UMZ73010.1 hypothetical protein ACONDI_00554 [Natranaerofaba carboxydovora]
MSILDSIEYTPDGRKKPKTWEQFIIREIQNDMESGEFREAFSTLIFYVYFKSELLGVENDNIVASLKELKTTMEKIAANGRVISDALASQVIKKDKMTERTMKRMNNLNKIIEIADKLEDDLGEFEPLDISEPCNGSKEIKEHLENCRMFFYNLWEFYGCLLRAGIEVAAFNESVKDICCELDNLESKIYRALEDSSSNKLVKDYGLTQLYPAALFVRLCEVAKNGLNGVISDNWTDDLEKTYNQILSIDIEKDLFFSEQLIWIMEEKNIFASDCEDYGEDVPF